MNSKDMVTLAALLVCATNKENKTSTHSNEHGHYTLRTIKLKKRKIRKQTDESLITTKL